MALVIHETREVNPHVENCVCGSNFITHSAEETNPTYGEGYAYAKCNACGLKMDEKSSQIGFGEQLEDLYLRVVNRWNRVMKK